MEFHGRAQCDLARMAKRKGEHALAAELWHEIAVDSQDGIHACEQLAIYYERRVKDYEKAMEFARQVRTAATEASHRTGLFFARAGCKA